jgi:hypothetical protein
MESHSVGHFGSAFSIPDQSSSLYWSESQSKPNRKAREGVQTFQGCKAGTIWSTKTFISSWPIWPPDQYADLNVIGQWLGIPNIINLFYMDQINQAVGRNQGLRQSNQRETKIVLITSKRLFDSVISKCCSEEESRTALYEIYDKPWRSLVCLIWDGYLSSSSNGFSLYNIRRRPYRGDLLVVWI